MKRIKLKDILLEQMDGYSVAQAKDEIEKDKEWKIKNEEYTKYIEALKTNGALQNIINSNQFYFPVTRKGFDPNAVNKTTKPLNELIKDLRYNYTGQSRKSECNNVIQYLISLYKEVTGKLPLNLIDQDIKTFWTFSPDGRNPDNYELCIPDQIEDIDMDWENNLSGYMSKNTVNIEYNKGDISFNLGPTSNYETAVKNIVEDWMHLYRFRTINDGALWDSYEFDHIIGFKLDKIRQVAKNLPDWESFSNPGLSGKYKTNLEYDNKYSNLAGEISGKGTLRVVKRSDILKLLRSASFISGPKSFGTNKPNGRAYANQLTRENGILLNIGNTSYLYCKFKYTDVFMFLELHK